MARTITSAVLLLILALAQPSGAGNPTFFGQNKPPSTGLTPPTFIQEAEATWNSSPASKSTASFSVNAGDVLVAYAACEGDWYPLSVSGGSLTWTLQRKVEAGTDYTQIYMWTAVVDTNKSMTVTFSIASAGQYYGGNVLTFRGSGGVGASAVTNVSSGAPTLNLTTTTANSAIVVANADWNAVSGASRTWRTGAGAVTEQTYSYLSANYTTYGGFHADAGAVGTYAVGLSAPAAQKYSIVAVEIKGQ